ncbi:CRISPR-associated protein, Cmr2 family [Marinactinospora thermotolerans DSM 45154]|uniref:CRISPR-associated protein, Cmr2 family n=1 Tax=Marinactinospora thermotolerans DSM 45154 TaxID=1122192 RepID=A0A1T4S4R7_9ACTN|nr:type III-B CRISPR-associated protein Cas10/Cmr2 [Marinactinospora thermotolerans]SKA23214.1 CRISPR-associated protein, Cmr2 family [Marinactinospora thermotolerans DSM 45154]
MSEHDPRDLVIVALSGVQRFITESRTTADAANASAITARLATEAALLLEEEGAELVIPFKADPSAASSRIAALTTAGQGPLLARAAADRVRSTWRRWITDLFGEPRDVPGFPEVMWSVAPAEVGGYAERWHAAQTVLASRKRLRAFDYPERTGTRPCAVSPRWPSEKAAPPGVPRHELASELSAAVWLKRRWHTMASSRSSPGTGLSPASPPSPESSPSKGFPSTASIASTPFRAQVLEHWSTPEVRDLVSELRKAARDVMGEERFRALEGAVPRLRRAKADPLEEWFVRGSGWWVIPETWNLDALAYEYATPDRPIDTNAVKRGLRAAEKLTEVIGAKPNPYYAVLAADLDGLGKRLSEFSEMPKHREISQRLRDLSQQHRRQIEQEHSGVTVYSGGDDLLAFLPAATALEAAQACRKAVGKNPTTLSTAVLFVHQGSPLHVAIARSRELLAEAKKVRGKNAVAVGYIAGSGAHSSTVRPWESEWVEDAVKELRVFKSRPGAPAEADGEGELSPRLINDLYSERAALAELATGSSRVRGVYMAEVTRLVLRHGGTEEQAQSLMRLGQSEHTEKSYAPVPLAAAQVALFLRRQTW